MYLLYAFLSHYSKQALKKETLHFITIKTLEIVFHHDDASQYNLDSSLGMSKLSCVSWSQCLVTRTECHWPSVLIGLCWSAAMCVYSSSL